MNVHGWWWHLFHDRMRDNLWSLAALVLIVAGIVAALWALTWLRDTWWPRRRRR